MALEREPESTCVGRGQQPDPGDHPWLTGSGLIRSSWVFVWGSGAGSPPVSSRPMLTQSFVSSS
jgi:hypothetical protein